ncbi:MAG: conjugal transfer protein TraG N-terminal domain-containing protein, partial [Pseudomonas helleri]|uniref:conjugal transfer protein TraG N-terminal domain-containing protein n=3 Tax=Pseudomonas helleri TaxID=1608996 RepID=UPI003F99793E
MDFSIYVLGDVSTFYSTINAVTMIFRSGGFMNGVYLVGGLIALLSGIMFMIQKSGGEQFIPANGPIGGLFGFGMVVACCSIQTSVTIEDIYTGNIAKVDHVPLIIAAPASLFTTASYSVFDRINTAFQSTSGSYMAVSQTGFITPMKLLMTLRKGVENVDPFLVASLKQFMIDCVPGSTTFNMNDFQASPDMVNYALSFARPNGLTTYWDNLNSLGKSMACQDASAKINTAVSAFPASANLKKLVNAGMKDKNPMGGAYTQVNVSEAITNLVPTMWSAAQSSDQFMTNALFFNSVWGTYNCLDSVQDQNSFNLCMVSLTQQDEQFRSDAVASGSFFAKLMMPTMIFLQLLFFGFAPIVIIYGLFKGAGALMAYVKYLGFGVWTSSWLPFSAVIQMYIQNDVADKMAQFTEKGLVPSNLQAVYYDVLATRLGIASDMLAATPLISAAMLGVTGYGMVSLASRWSGRDHNDEKLQSPDILKNGAHVDVASRNQYSSENAGSARAGLIKAGSNWNSADLKETLSQSKSSALGEDHTKRSESSQAVEASLRQVMSYKQGDTWSNQEMQSLERSHTSMTQQSMKMADKLADSLGLTGSKRDSFKQNFNAEVGFSGIFGGVKTGIASATGKEMSADQATKINSEFGTEIAKNESDMKGWKAAASSAFAHSSGKEAATENSLGRRLSSTTADTQSSFQRFQKATTAEASVSAGVKISEETSGANLISSPQAMQALNSAISNLNSSQREAFNKKFPELETRYDQNSVGMQGKREAAQLWALNSVDSSAFANVVSAMQSGSISGPTDNNAGRFEGVGGRAQQVSDNPGGNVANANVGRPSLNVPGVSADQVGPSGAPEQKTLKSLVKGLDPSGNQELSETFINSQMPGGVLNGQDKIRTARHKVEKGDTSISVQDMTDTMSGKPIANAVSAVGNKEQQWEEENPKTAMAVTAGSMLIPGAGWGGATVRGVQYARAGAASYKAAQGLRAAETGVEVAQAARVANAAGREIPAVLRGPGQASRIVDAEHVKEATETAAAASKVFSSAGRDAQKATKFAAKTSTEPAMFLTAKSMADNDQTEAGANAGADAPLNPGSAVHSMRQETNHDQSQQPLMMPMAPAADPLAALGGHSGNLTSVGGNAPQQFGPISTNPAPATRTAPPVAPQRGNAGTAPAGSGKAQSQANAPASANANAAVAAGATMSSPHPGNAENATPAGSGEAQPQPTAPLSTNTEAEAPLNPGSATLSMRQETNQAPSQEPMMMPMPPAADQLAALGGHPGTSTSGGGNEPQQFGPISANPAPAAHTTSPVAPQRGNAGKSAAGSGRALPQATAPASANAAVAASGAAMSSPHRGNEENASPAGSGEAQILANAPHSANTEAEAPLNSGSAMLSMRQDSNQEQSQQPLVMPMAPAAEPLAALGGHSDGLAAAGGGESPINAPAPAAPSAPPVAPQRGRGGKSKAGSGKPQPQATALASANPAVAAPGAAMSSPHGGNEENASPAGSGEAQILA